jgi:hypothetical protein
VAAGAGLAVDGFAEAQPLGRGLCAAGACPLRRDACASGRRGRRAGAPVALRQGGAQGRHCCGIGAGAAQQQGQRGKRAGEPGVQAFAVLRRFGVRFDARTSPANTASSAARRRWCSSCAAAAAENTAAAAQARTRSRRTVS